MRYRLHSTIESIEARIMLSGTAADVPIGSYALSNNDRSPVQIGLQQGAQVVDIREVLANTDERVPNLNTLEIEIGPYKGESSPGF